MLMNLVLQSSSIRWETQMTRDLFYHFRFKILNQSPLKVVINDYIETGDNSIANVNIRKICQLFEFTTSVLRYCTL